MTAKNKLAQAQKLATRLQRIDKMQQEAYGRADQKREERRTEALAGVDPDVLRVLEMLEGGE